MSEGKKWHKNGINLIGAEERAESVEAWKPAARKTATHYNKTDARYWGQKVRRQVINGRTTGSYTVKIQFKGQTS